MKSKLIIVLVAFLTIANALAQSEDIDLLKDFEPQANDIVAGSWTKTADGLQSDETKAARVIVRRELPKNYDLTVEFTRQSGDNAVAIILPVGTVSPALELSGWNGQAHGLSRVRELPVNSPNNPTSVRPGVLENGKRYRLEVAVRGAAPAAAKVSAKLDGEALFDWSGPVSQLQPNFALNVEESGALALVSTDSAAVFHRAVLKSAAADPDPAPTPTSTPIGAEWEPFNGAAFQFGADCEIQSRPEVGAKDRGAFRSGITFSTGVIEVELKGNAQPQGSFLGVVFHGVDGETYDSVYFRPFNFGSADETRRGHAVQYMSHPNFPWNELRRDRPEQFENPASPEPQPTDWFKARIDVAEDRIKVFIDDADEPCLDVEKLGDVKSGKVGLWFNGVASFRNFRVTSD
ncbi:MAG: hypothetical protein AAF585_07935 [Verrucomicrobiota bacterium]